MVLHQDMVPSLTSKFVARSFASLAQVLMIHPRLLMTFVSGQPSNRFYTRSYTARKVFYSGTSTWICEIYLLQRASRTLWKPSKHRILPTCLLWKHHSTP